MELNENMKAEKIILSFIALLIGLGVAGGAFYFYQTSKNKEAEKKQSIQIIIPTPTINKSDRKFLITKPKDEEVFDTNTVTISGKTEAETTVIVRTENDEKIGESTKKGDFSFTISLDEGVNPIEISSVFNDGSIISEEITISYVSEEF